MTTVHWEVVTLRMRDVMQVIGRSDLVSRFYLAGGTALALQLGHRRSVDLDLFSEVDAVRPPTYRHILSALENLRPTVVEQEWGNLLLVIDDLHVGFFSYGYRLVAPTQQAEGVPLAGLADIGLMKLDALASRGSRKDFCDLYFVAQHVSLRELFDLATTKYPSIRDFEAMVVRYMADFDRADQETPLPLFHDVDWKTIKTFFCRQAVLLGRDWLAQDK